MEKIIKDIEELKLNKVYGIINKEQDQEKKELYILKGIMKNNYIFDKALIIQNNNKEKLLAISDNKYNQYTYHKCKIKELIKEECIVLLVELKDKECECNCCSC